MNKTHINQQYKITFDSIRHQDESGHEYWRARQLAKVLEYSEYRHFLPVITRAKAACRNSGQNDVDHFEDVLDMVDIGSGAQRPVEDVRLSRYACYLIVQNGDPSKPIIANGQTYFALQTQRQELADDAQFSSLSEAEKRLAIRNELAANLFRATQTEEKLRRDGVQGKRQANQTHHEVGNKVRQTIQDLGGTMPENLPVPQQSIQQLESAKRKRIKQGE